MAKTAEKQSKAAKMRDAAEKKRERTELVTIGRKFTEDDVWSLLVSAFEGGSNYWYMIDNDKTVYAPGKSRKDFYYIHEIPFEPGCALIVQHDDGGDGPWVNCKYPLTRERLVEGMRLLAASETYKHHWADIINENTDATTGDVYLQFCVFGEVIYG